MNKKTILCTVLALCMVLIGTGYAYWTDTLNVTTKATTGDLDVSFVDLGAYAKYDNEEFTDPSWSIIDGVKRDTNGFIPADYFRGGGYNDVFGDPDAREDYYDDVEKYNSVEFDAKIDGAPLTENYGALPYGTGDIAGDTIKIQLDNLYPGYAQAFRADIINTGSIAAKLSQVEFTAKNGTGSPLTNDAKDLIGVALLVNDEDPNEYGDIVKLASKFKDDDVFELGGVKFVRLSALEDITTIDDNLLLVPTDDSQQRMDMFIGIAVDPDEAGVYTTGTAANRTNNVDANTQNKFAQIDIRFVWDQFNAGPDSDANASNILENQN